ncbi:MAG: KOW domain-containing RNA-binding protein [Bacilli bacterium]
MELGRVVKSIKGRDQGKTYIIWKVLDKDFILVVDGNKRLIASPKKKRIKHIEYLDYRLDNIGVKIQSGQKVFDSEIYSNLKKIQNTDLMNGGK